MKIFKISTFISVLIISGWVFYLLIYPKLTIAKEITIPLYSGESIESVLDSCHEIGLKPNIIYQEGLTEGVVLSTFPKEKTLVKKDSIINLYVSKTKELTWPLFVGRFYKDVESSIKEFCLENSVNYEIKYIVNNDLPENIISTQNKEYNSIVTDKSLILEVVIHDNILELPDFVGMDLDEVIILLNEYKLNYKCNYEYSLAPFNTILEQSIKEGTKLLKGNQTEIVFYVSKGLDIPTGLVGMDLINACLLLERYGVNYEIVFVHSNLKNIVLEIDKHLYYDGYIDTIYLIIGK